MKYVGPVFIVLGILAGLLMAHMIFVDHDMLMKDHQTMMNVGAAMQQQKADTVSLTHRLWSAEQQIATLQLGMKHFSLTEPKK